MRVDALDICYLSMPDVMDIGDGSPTSPVRVQSGSDVGWGGCKASSLTTIASLIAPMSHSARKPVYDPVLGQWLDDLAAIDRIGRLVRENSADLL